MSLKLCEYSSQSLEKPTSWGPYLKLQNKLFIHLIIKVFFLHLPMHLHAYNYAGILDMFL